MGCFLSFCCIFWALFISIFSRNHPNWSLPRPFLSTLRKSCIVHSSLLRRRCRVSACLVYRRRIPFFLHFKGAPFDNTFRSFLIICNLLFSTKNTISFKGCITTINSVANLWNKTRFPQCKIVRKLWQAKFFRCNVRDFLRMSEMFLNRLLVPWLSME